MPDDTAIGLKAAPLKDIFVGSPYKVLQRLAAGGMAEVFLVEHPELGRQFVAKVLREQFATDTRLLDRMRVEAQTLGRLNHDNIVSVFGFGVTRDGRPFIVMEHLQGRTLAAEIEARGALPPREALAYVIQLLAALEAGHALGVVHRDVKPDNLFLADCHDGARVLKLLDYGLARILPGFSGTAPEPLLPPTETGLVLGTPRFMSPEGARGMKVDIRGDVYGAGLVLYLALAGRGPFDHLREQAQILRAHADLQPVTPSAAAGVAQGTKWHPLLDEIVLCALRKNPRSRYRDARHFRSFLEQFAEAMDAGLRPDSGGPKRAVPAQPSNQAAARTGTNREPESLPTSASVSLHVPSTPSLRQLLLFVGVVALTAVAVSQIVRLLLTR